MPGSQEVLATFLDFLRVATATEREWSPRTDDLDARPGLSDQDYELRARDLARSRALGPPAAAVPGPEDRAVRMDRLGRPGR